jgi:hypothetical protein
MIDMAPAATRATIGFAKKYFAFVLMLHPILLIEFGASHGSTLETK